jgi:YbgC/YbaW family acyl-CoA thioester hydrolase
LATPFRTKRIVEFGDTDMAGIVHFSKFFHYMEAAEHAFLRSLGISVVMELDGVPLGLPRVAASCDYLRPARFADELEICVRVRRLGRSSVTYAFDVLKGAEPVARGQITAVWCHHVPGHKLEAIDIPEPIRLKLQAFLEKPAE